MNVIKNRKIFFTLSAILVAVSLLLVFVRGLEVGIDFVGGTKIEVTYEDARMETSQLAIEERLLAAGFEGVLIQPVDSDEGASYFIRTVSLSDAERERFTDILRNGGSAELAMQVDSVTTVGPTIGKELKSKAWIAIVTVVVAIILFIAYVFRGVSEPVSSWRYGFIAIVALVHDIIIPTGVASLVGVEIDSLFVIALLAILGLSVNDTIVVFDRVRENLRNKVSKHFDETVGKSLEQTYVRSLNTSITTLFVVLTLFFLGPDTTKDFALILATGLVAGTYSSIFLASPLLVEVEKRQEKE
jgi:preprotein translocase subunit SecF